MKIMRFLCILGFLLIGTTTFAADGDMIVNGQVGVGTTSPSTPLEVNGIIKSSTGGVRFPDNTTQTTALPASCTNGQIPKWNGTQWACAADDSGGERSASITIQISVAMLAKRSLQIQHVQHMYADMMEMVIITGLSTIIVPLQAAIQLLL